MCEPQWGIAYHSNSNSPRARKWYRVTRLVYADSKWWELYWHSDSTLRGDSLAKLRAAAKHAGLTLLPDLFAEAPAPRHGPEMVPYKRPLFIVCMYAPGWARVFLSFHRSRAAAERQCRKHARQWAHRPAERRFEVFEA